MTITPEQARKLAEEIYAPEVKKLEEKIDEQLVKELTDYSERIIIRPSSHSNPLVRKLVERKYSEAGWNVKYQSDQRDGDWWEFRPKKEGCRR
jgi:hypothetical protein